MPKWMDRPKPLKIVILALPIGAALTLSSWIVWQGMWCNDALLCGFPTLARGFPLPWVREFATPNIPPYHGTIERIVNFENLAADLAVWSWLSFVALLVGYGEVRQRVEELFQFRLKVLGLSAGTSAIIAGFILAVFVFPPQQREFILPDVYSLSLLGYFAIVLGAVAFVATYRKSGVAIWWTSVSLGILATLGTCIFLRRLIETGSSSSSQGGTVIYHAGEYGLPVGWILIDQSASPIFRYTLIGWAFVIDVLIWGSLMLAALVLVALRKAKHD